MDRVNNNNVAARVDLASICRDVIREWWVILLLSLSVGMIGNVAVKQFYKPDYTVTSAFAVTTKGVNTNIYQNLTTAQEVATRFSQILSSPVLKRQVALDLGVEDYTASTTATVLEETNLIELTVTSDSALEAYRVMCSIMENYDTVSEYVVSDVVLEVIQEPLIPTEPSNPLDLGNTTLKIFAVAAAVFAVLLAFFSYLRDTVKKPSEVSEKLDTRLLGTIYHERKRKTLRDFRRKEAFPMLIRNPLLSFRFVESNKMTASRIRSYMDKEEAQVLLVTSVMENEGKSTVAANIALSLAQEGKNVILMDCDFRKPSQYRIFDLEEDHVQNLADVLKTGKGIEHLITNMEETGIYTVFNNTPSLSAEDFFGNGIIQKLFAFLRGKMDYIIVDSSPLMLVSATEELAQMTDASVLVVRRDVVLTKDINDAIDTLNQTGSKVLGCVFNDASAGITGGGSYGYGYGGHYGYGGYYGKQSES